MPTRVTVLAAIVCLFAAGCFVPSLHPLYTTDDVAFDSALVGKWAEEDSQEIWDFRQYGDHAYRLTYTNDKGLPGLFDVHLVELGGQRFLDLCPVRDDSDVNEIYEMHLLPMHSFMHLKQIEPVLQMAILEPDSVEAFLGDHPDAVPNDTVDKMLILTASTDELRRFVPAHVTEEPLFGDYSALKKSD